MKNLLSLLTLLALVSCGSGGGGGGSTSPTTEVPPTLSCSEEHISLGVNCLDLLEDDGVIDGFQLGSGNVYNTQNDFIGTWAGDVVSEDTNTIQISQKTTFADGDNSLLVVSLTTDPTKYKSIFQNDTFKTVTLLTSTPTQEANHNTIDCSEIDIVNEPHRTTGCEVGFEDTDIERSIALSEIQSEYLTTHQSILHESIQPKASEVTCEEGMRISNAGTTCIEANIAESVSSTPEHSDVGRKSVTILDGERYLRFEGSGDTITISAFDLDGKLINYSDDEDSFRVELTIPTETDWTDVNIDTVALTTRTWTTTDGHIQDHYLAMIKFTYRDAAGTLLSEMRGYKFDRQTTNFSGRTEIANLELTATQDEDVTSLEIHIYYANGNVYFWIRSSPNYVMDQDVVTASEFE